MYAVKYHEDGEIYRAKVVDRDANENQVQVHFIDYGNHEVVPENEVLMLPEKFHEDSQFASMIRLKARISQKAKIYHFGCTLIILIFSV